MENTKTTKFKSPQSFKMGYRSGVGRPRVDEDAALPPRINISFSLEQHDWLMTQAKIREQTISGIIRDLVDNVMSNK